MTDFDLVLGDARVVTPSGVLNHGWVGIQAGKIVTIEEGAVPKSVGADAVQQLEGAWLDPGFVDVHVHVHGSNGIEVMETDADGFRQLARFFLRHGVTSFLVGTYTLEHVRILETLRLVNETGEYVAGGANIVGAYLEGPFLSPARRGAHREDLLRAISREHVAEYLEIGVVRAFVVAPELPDADWVIQELVRRGVTAVAGHTDATYSEIERAVTQGVSAVTHTFNGMRGFHHREPGVAGAALLIEDLICELIADGVHVAPQLMPLFWRMKGSSGLALVTDANQAGGLADDTYRNGDREVVVKDGVARLRDGTISSSAKTYDYDFALFCQFAGIPFDEAWSAASSTSAKIAGVHDRKGTIEVGKDADIAVLSERGAVVGTAVRGEWIPIGGRAA